MTGFVYGPVAQFLDNNGTPLTGGQVWVYEAGTSVLLNSFNNLNDALAGTNPQENPVELNARGECIIIINAAARLVLEAADIDPNTGHGSVIWDQPNFRVADVT